MTLNSSLRSRVRRLEARRAEAARPGMAELMRQARARLNAMTPAQRAAERCQSVARGVAALELPTPNGDSMEDRLMRIRVRRGRRHLSAMASLDEPDLVEPSPFDVEAHCAWADQKHRRREAREYLADVALAGDLLTSPAANNHRKA
jgi:hypothetical protein